MKQKRKIVHVELKEPFRSRRHYYFGSVAAIYDFLPKDIVGISKESLWNEQDPERYENKKVIIRYGTILTKESNRGNKK